MRIFLSGNEEVARYHLPVVRSKAEEFAARIERSGLKQSTMYFLFKDTGTWVSVSYVFGQVNVAVVGGTTPGGDEITKVERGDLYEWNTIGNFERISRGDKGTFLGSTCVCYCDFDAGALVVEIGDLTIGSDSIPNLLADNASSLSGMTANRYCSHVVDQFFISKIDKFFSAYSNEFILHNIWPHGVFKAGFSYYAVSQLFRCDYISSGTKVLPSSKLFVADGIIVHRHVTTDDTLVTSTEVLPAVTSTNFQGINLFNAVNSEWNGYYFVYPWGGLWSGDYITTAYQQYGLSKFYTYAGDSVAWVTGETSQGNLIDRDKGAYFDPVSYPECIFPDDWISVYSSYISLTIHIVYLDEYDTVQTTAFTVMSDYEVTASGDIWDILNSSFSGRIHCLGNGYERTCSAAGVTYLANEDYCVTMEWFELMRVGKHFYIKTSDGTPSPNFIFWDNNNWSFVGCNLSNSTGYALSGNAYLSYEAMEGAAKNIGPLEFGRNGVTFYGVKTDTATGVNDPGIFELVKSGTSVTLIELMIFARRWDYPNMLFWFSENYETIMLKGTASNDGVWVRSGNSYSALVSDVSGYVEPVYISRDGTCVALKDKIYINGTLVQEPEECVGVFHTHTHYVDKISASQFAIKDMSGNVILTTLAGLYNYYELTDDSSYALLSKIWWNESDNVDTDVALVVSFCDGPLKFETCDTPLLRQKNPEALPISPRYNITSGYAWPNTWCRAFMPGKETATVYYKQNARTLVSCREDGFAERAHNYSESERVSAFLWHPDLGLLKRLQNTTSIIPYDVLHWEKKTTQKVKG